MQCINYNIRTAHMLQIEYTLLFKKEKISNQETRNLQKIMDRNNRITYDNSDLVCSTKFTIRKIKIKKNIGTKSGISLHPK